METLTPADFVEDLNPLNNVGRRVFVKGLGFVSVALLLGTLGRLRQISRCNQKQAHPAAIANWLARGGC